MGYAILNKNMYILMFTGTIRKQALITNDLFLMNLRSDEYMPTPSNLIRVIYLTDT